MGYFPSLPLCASANRLERNFTLKTNTRRLRIKKVTLMRKLFLNLIDVTEDMQMVLEQVSENTNLRI